MNEDRNIDRFLEKNKKDGTDSLLFVINIGQNDGKTHISGNGNPGCHWIICSYGSTSNK